MLSRTTSNEAGREEKPFLQVSSLSKDILRSKLLCCVDSFAQTRWKEVYWPRGTLVYLVQTNVGRVESHVADHHKIIDGL